MAIHISQLRHYYYSGYRYYDTNDEFQMGFTACMLIIGVSQGILAVTVTGLSCKSFCCNKSPYPGNVLYTVPNNQYYPNFAPPNYQQSAFPVQNASRSGLPEVGNLGYSGQEATEFGNVAMNSGASRDTPGNKQ